MLRRLRRNARFARAEIAVLGSLALGLMRFLRMTTRMTVHNGEVLEGNWRRGRAMVFVSWHGRSIMLPFTYRGHSVHILNSTHRDGQIITHALLRLGMKTSPGSSTRRAIAGTLGLVRALAAGGDVALVTDGPRGPAGVAKPGAVELAMSAGAPVVPMAFSARPALRLSGWDRMMLPVPGGKVVCVVGEPIEVGKGRDPALRESLRAEVERRLAELCRHADRLAGRPEEPV